MGNAEQKVRVASPESTNSFLKELTSFDGMLKRNIELLPLKVYPITYMQLCNSSENTHQGQEALLTV